MFCIFSLVCFSCASAQEKLHWYGAATLKGFLNNAQPAVQPFASGGVNYKQFGAGMGFGYEADANKDQSGFIIAADLLYALPVGKKHIVLKANPGWFLPEKKMIVQSWGWGGPWIDTTYYKGGLYTCLLYTSPSPRD